MFVIGTFLLFRRYPRWLPGIAYFLYVYTLMLASCIVLEQGAFITEQQITSHPNNAFFLLLGYLIFFLMGFLAAAHLLNPLIPLALHKPRAVIIGSQYLTAKHVEWILFIFIVGIILLLIAHTLLSGSPILGQSDATKTTFWRDVARVPQLQKVNNQLFALFFAFAVISTSARRLIFLIALGIFHFSLMGHRYSAFTLLIYFATYPAIQCLNLRNTLSWRLLVAGLIFGVVVVILSYLTYSTSADLESGRDIFDFAVYRVFVLQGHTWWGVVEHVRINGPHGDLFQFLEHDSMDAIMRIIAPLTLYNSYVEGNTTFTMAYPALLHLTIGLWGIPLQFAIGAMFAVAIFLLHICSRLGFVGAFFSVKIFQAIFLFLVMGSTGFILDPDIIIYGLLLLLYIVVAAGADSNRNRKRQVYFRSQTKCTSRANLSS